VEEIEVVAVDVALAVLVVAFLAVAEPEA